MSILTIRVTDCRLGDALLEELTDAAAAAYAEALACSPDRVCVLVERDPSAPDRSGTDAPCPPLQFEFLVPDGTPLARRAGRIRALKRRLDRIACAALAAPGNVRRELEAAARPSTRTDAAR